MLALNLIQLRASIAFVATPSLFCFIRLLDSKHMTCLYTARFTPKTVSADKRKNLLGCGSPAETSAKQKHRPRRQPRQAQPPWQKSRLRSIENTNEKIFFQKGEFGNWCVTKRRKNIKL
jgi:hypothetical protein